MYLAHAEYLSPRSYPPTYLTSSAPRRAHRACVFWTGFYLDVELPAWVSVALLQVLFRVMNPVRLRVAC